MDINSFVIGFKKGKASGGNGGGSVENANTVTFMSEDGSTVLYQLQVLDGNTCADVVEQGIIATPTKDSTPQTVYTYSGWSLTSGGAADSNALFNITEDRTVYAAFAGAVRYYTITFYDGDTVLKSESIPYGAMPQSFTPEKEEHIFQYWEPEIEAVTGDAAYYAKFIEQIILENASWAKISELSENGLSENYFAVGDRKKIAVKGKVGTVDIDATYYVFIIGFDHNSELEGTGIHFGTFKDAATGGNDIALYGGTTSTSTSGKKYFNMSHWGKDNNGGWAGCDLRYDVLGSTDKAPSGYGKAAATGRVGYDPSVTCATNPVPNTLMAALPADLRAVLKPMTKYTDNTGGWNETAEMVTATIDYLPFLAEFEIYGKRERANQYEQNKQAQYAYYAAGGSRVKISSNSGITGSGFEWLTRSVSGGSGHNFINITNMGQTFPREAYKSSHISPIFKV